MTSVLVSGSAGFVGKHLVRELQERGHIVYQADRKDGYDLANLDTALDRAYQTRPDVIVHLAGTCSTPGSIRDPMTTYRDTAQTAVNMLEAARLNGSQFILTSSVKARDGRTPYGAAKRMAELWAREYNRAFDVPVVINRPGTIYGPGQQGSEESGWIAWFCKARDENLPVVINGDGSQRRDLLHVSDYVNLLVKQVENPIAYGDEIWDVGGGPVNTVTVVEMANWLGLDFSMGPARYGDAQSYVGWNDVPGWEPVVYWKESTTLCTPSLSRR